MNRRILLLAALLSGCGGGGTDPIDTYSIYGDSYTATNPSSAEQLTDILGTSVTSFARGGCTTKEAYLGTNLSFSSFNSQMQGLDTSKYIILRFGIADAFYQTSENFGGYLEKLIESALASNKKVLLVNMVDLTVIAELYERHSNFTANNIIIEKLAVKYNVSLIDLRKVVPVTRSMMHADMLHFKPEVTYSVNIVLASLIKEATKS